MDDQEGHDPLRYRKRLRITQAEAVRLLGWRNRKGLALIESGRVLPTLTTAFKLGIIYRVPVEFLFRSLYERLREQIQRKENSTPEVGQQKLPLTQNH